MDNKLLFYQWHDVEEYYLYDPDERQLEGWQRRGDVLAVIPQLDGWISPHLGIRFDLSERDLRIFSRVDRLFLDLPELDEQREQAEQYAEQEHQRAEHESQKAVQERQRAEQAERHAAHEKLQGAEALARAERLAAQLRVFGIAPE